MQFTIMRCLWLMSLCALAQADLAPTELSFSPDPVDLTPEVGSTADKARLLRLTDGTLVVTWHEASGIPGGAWSLSGTAFAPRDIFVVTSVDGGTSWSDPVNVSNSAASTDASVFYDRVGDGTGLANYFGDSGKASLIASGNNLAITWHDTYCGDGAHGPANYAGPLGTIEVPFRCLYVARLLISTGSISVIAVDRLTDGTRDVTNEVLRATGAGFALAWQEDPAGLQLGEARGEGDGASGARVTPGTDIWYAWISKSEFTNAVKTWHGPVAVSDNFDYTNSAATGGGASRPIMAMAGSPPYVMLVYEESKGGGLTDIGKHVLFHQFAFNAPPDSEAGVIVSAPGENSRRARVVAVSSPGSILGTRMLLLWRQGAGIQGAPADFMMRVGAVAPGTDQGTVPNAGFRVKDLRPAVDPSDPLKNAPALNISGAKLDDATSVDPLANAKAHRAVIDGDFIYAGYTQDMNADDGVNEFQYFLRWSANGGSNWAAPERVSEGVPGSENVIEPRLIRTPGTVPTGAPEDIHNPDIFVVAWGTEVQQAGALEPIRDALFVTRTVDRGQSFEPVQALAEFRTAPGQTDEQVQLRVTPDGQSVAAVWIRRDAEDADVLFSSAVGMTLTADLSVDLSTTDLAPDVGDALQMTVDVGNDGPHTATELRLTIAIPSGLSLTGVTTTSGACEIAVPVSCELDDLGAAANVLVELSFVVEVQGTLTVTAQVTAREEDPASLNDFAEVVIEAIPNADINVQLTADVERLEVGSLFNLRYEVFNSGPQSGSDVVLTILLPSHVTVLWPTGCEFDVDKLICSQPDLPVDEAWSSTLNFRAVRAGIASISASAGATENDPYAEDNAVTISVLINEAKVGSRGSGGCVYDPDGRDDAMLILLIFCMSWRLWSRQIAHRLAARLA